MVFTIQCPKCRKFMLVEDRERGKIVTCLLCKEPIRIGDTPAPAAQPGGASRPSRP